MGGREGGGITLFWIMWRDIGGPGRVTTLGVGTVNEKQLIQVSYSFKAGRLFLAFTSGQIRLRCAAKNINKNIPEVDLC